MFCHLGRPQLGAVRPETEHGVVDPERQAFDAGGDTARRYAADAMADPLAFLDYEAVFPPALRTSTRFRAAFVESYRRIAEHGPIAAMGPEAEPQPAGGTR